MVACRFKTFANFAAMPLGARSRRVHRRPPLRQAPPLARPGRFGVRLTGTSWRGGMLKAPARRRAPAVGGSSPPMPPLMARLAPSPPPHRPPTRAPRVVLARPIGVGRWYIASTVLLAGLEQAPWPHGACEVAAARTRPSDRNSAWRPTPPPHLHRTQIGPTGDAEPPPTFY